MFKVIVAGGRDFLDYNLLEQKLDKLLINKSDVRIISGMAKGADKLGETYASIRKLGVEVYPAEWEKFGKSAGYKRNEVMADHAEALVAFWDGKSRGTKHMIDIAKAKGLALRVIIY